jgi:UDP-N-acetylmuramate--alanine ligase
MMRPFPDGPAHMVGIGGYGMRGLARLFARDGRRVTGSDAAAGPVLARLGREGIACTAEPDLPQEAAFVVYSAAVPAEAPALQSAAARGLPCYKYAAALGRYCRGRRVIACAGTHGKSTSTAIMAWLLRRAGLDAGFVVGAEPAPGMTELPANARPGDPMVIEACEYDRSFLHFRPHAALITNVEREHVDCFPTEAELLAAFSDFVGRVEPGGVLAVPAELVPRLPAARRSDIRLVTFGRKGQWRGEAVNETNGVRRLRIAAPGGMRFTVRCALPGAHNIANVTAVVALAATLFGVDRIAAAGRDLAGFRGLRRRFEVVWNGRTVIIDDYAHHPTEIAVTIRAVRERFPGARRTIAVFQPHQRRRLEALAADFARSLRGADRVLVTPVFAAREGAQQRGAASASFVRRLGAQAAYCSDFETARRELLALLEPRDVVLCLGAGDITDFATEISRAVALRENGHGA